MDEPLHQSLRELIVLKPHEVEARVLDVLKICEDKTVPTLPVLSFLMKQAKEASPEGEVFRLISEKLLELAKFPYISLTKISKAPNEEQAAMSLKWRQRDLDDLSISLTEIGLPLSTENLESKIDFNVSSDNESQTEMSMSDLLAQLQFEVAGLYSGTRFIEEMKRLAINFAPDIHIPQNQYISTSEFADLFKKENGSAGLLRNDGGGFIHLVSVLSKRYSEFSGDNLGLLQRSISSNEPIILGEHAGETIRAAHEYLGHSSFFELFPQDTIEEYLKQVYEQRESRKHSAHLDDALNEGFAISNEEYFGDLLAKLDITSNSDATTQAVQKFRDARREHSMQYQDDPTIRVYPDGQKLIQILTASLGINKLREFISTLDLVELSKISSENPLYHECLRDPLNKLPIKVVSAP